MTKVVRRGSPGGVIVEEALGADLVVVGHRGDSRISLMLGSTANYVLHHATCPVVVVRGDQPCGDPRRVTVGVDAEDLCQPDADNESVRALRWAYQLPRVGRIGVLHGWSVSPLVLRLLAQPKVDAAEMDTAAEAAIKQVVDAAGPVPDGITVVPEVEHAPGGQALVKASRGEDLIVVGSRGRGGLTGLLLGSTSAEVVARSNAPVVVVR